MPLARRYRSKRKKGSRTVEVQRRKSNPPAMTELAEFILPGFGGFAATRFGTYVVTTQLAKRSPTWAPHAGAIASVGTFLAAWFLAHRVKFLEKWATPIAVGAGIATLQTLIQIYLPKLGWMVSDASSQVTGGDPTAAVQLTAAQAAAVDPNQAPAGLVATSDDPNAYTYDDRYDPGIMRDNSRYYGQMQGGGNGGGSQQQQAQAPTPSDSDLDDLDLSDNVFSGGAVAQN